MWSDRSLVLFGSWFEHVKRGYALSKRDNVLFLSYEGMKGDEAGTVKKIAQFLGKRISRRSWFWD